MDNEKIAMNKKILYYMRKQEIGDEMLWKKAAIDQEIFMRDIIGMNLLKVPMFVVSWHTSKSISLPVYGFVMRNGIKVITRYNFYDWKLSIVTPQKLPDDFIPEDLVSGGYGEGHEISDCYLEGFRSEWSYGPYLCHDTPNKFTIEVGNKFHVYVLLYMLNKAFNRTVFDVDKDTRTVEEIAESIKEIYTDNGVYEMYQSDRFGKDKPFEEAYMSGWEVLWSTHCKLDDVLHEEREKDPSIKYCMAMDVAEDPKEYAEEICKRPEVKRTFLMEESFFKTKF